MRQQYVVRFDIAMHHAARVGVRQCAGDVTQNAHTLRDRQSGRGTESSAQRLALNERHREIRHAVRRPRSQQRHNVRLLQRRRKLNLAAEALKAHARRHIVRQHLDHDFAIETDLARQKDTRHSAATEFMLDDVLRGECGGESGECLAHAAITNARLHVESSSGAASSQSRTCLPSGTLTLLLNARMTRADQAAMAR